MNLRLRTIEYKRKEDGTFRKGISNPWKGKELPWSEKAAEARRRSGMYNHVWNKGIKCEYQTAEKHYAWKGLEATLEAKHAWVVRRIGKPQKCEHCETTEKRMYHWANVSGKYLRDISDYIRLCVPCHKRYDLNRL